MSQIATNLGYDLSLPSLTLMNLANSQDWNSVTDGNQFISMTELTNLQSQHVHPFEDYLTNFMATQDCSDISEKQGGFIFNDE